MRFIPTTDKDRRAMLASIGVETLDELFACVPCELRLKEDLPLPPPLSEAEVVRKVRQLAEKNLDLDHAVSFLGAGYYDRLIPRAIHHLISRGEFLTAYTPYQAEVSQGVLQSIFEYQSLITEITGMDAANASMYDGATALAEAALMACNVTRRDSVIVPGNLHPHWMSCLELYLAAQSIKVKYLPYGDRTGSIDLEQAAKMVDKKDACLIVQHPNFFGVLEETRELARLIHDAQGLLVMAVDPIGLGILQPPGDTADIVVGEGQSLGNHLSFGGPGLGFFAVRGTKLVRRLPGRVVGQTTDSQGKRGFVLTMQTREQHIRREKATSNICSNQALNALAAAIYLALLGKEGYREVAFQTAQKSHYLLDKLEEVGFRRRFSGPFFQEFVIQADCDWQRLNSELLAENIIGGLPLGDFYPHLTDSLLIAVTEARTREEMDRFVELLRRRAA